MSEFDGYNVQPHPSNAVKKPTTPPSAPPAPRNKRDVERLAWLEKEVLDKVVESCTKHLEDIAKKMYDEQLFKDAERYRWLRDNWFVIYGQSKGSGGIVITKGDCWNYAGLPEHVDIAIDEAMKGE